MSYLFGLELNDIYIYSQKVILSSFRVFPEKISKTQQFYIFSYSRNICLAHKNVNAFLLAKTYFYEIKIYLRHFY